MFTKTNRWIFAGFAILFIVAFAALSMTEQASAAPTTTNSTNSCLSCHEDLYYLHDTGCWYCMADAHRDRCTDCHEGNAASFKVEESHVGMLRHPQENNGAKCRQCHAEDVDARLDTFDSKVGFEKVIEPIAYTPVQPTALGFPETAQPGIAEKLPWVAGGVALFGFWLALVLLSPKKP
jgi:nitrate/TMAO reductase-like tetraheme cytochrome c subunit